VTKPNPENCKNCSSKCPCAHAWSLVLQLIGTVLYSSDKPEPKFTDTVLRLSEDMS